MKIIDKSIYPYEIHQDKRQFILKKWTFNKKQQKEVLKNDEFYSNNIEYLINALSIRLMNLDKTETDLGGFVEAYRKVKDNLVDITSGCRV